MSTSSAVISVLFFSSILLIAQNPSIRANAEEQKSSFPFPLNNGQNQQLRELVNKAAGGIQVIPEGTAFELKGWHGTSTEKTVIFPDGSKAVLSTSSYSSSSGSNSNGVVSLLPLIPTIMFMLVNLIIFLTRRYY